MEAMRVRVGGGQREREELDVDVEEEEDKDEDQMVGLPPRGGRECLFTQEQELAIVQMVQENIAIRLRELQQRIIADRMIFNNINRVSISTLSRILQKHNFRMKQLYRVPFERNSVRVKDLCHDYVQTVLDFDATEQPHEVIYVDEAGFNLAKTRRRGRKIVGQRAVVNVPGQCGENITLCSAISVQGVLHHLATLGPYNTGQIIVFLDALHAVVQDKPQQPRPSHYHNTASQKGRGRRSSDDISMLTEAVVGFIGKVADDTVQKNTIGTFSNQKLWVDKTIHDALRSRSAAYNTGLATGDMNEYKAASYSVRRVVKDAKRHNGRKLESQFQNGGSRILWQGLRTITDYKTPSSKMVNADAFLADELNTFYARFEAAANHASGASGTTSMHAERAGEVNTFTISEHDVRRAFKRVNTRKAAGPDGITGRVLKACTDQLAPVFTEIFNLSLEQSVVPSCFKQSTIVPVPKKPQPACLNVYRPVALTSVVIKCFERLTVLDFDATEQPHEVIYVDEAGFNLAKTRRRGRKIVGQRAVVNVPGQCVASGNSVHSHGPIVYTRDQLLAFRNTPMLLEEKPDIPRELRRRRRGNRAGALCRNKRRRYRPTLPSIVMGNVRSLPNKMDELAALTRHQREFRECSIMLFTESWLTKLTPDTTVALDVFDLLRADRTMESGRRKGGGLAVFVNNRWCKTGHITIKEQICCKDIELLAASMRPYYLPREFSHVIAIAAYIPPSADASSSSPTSLCTAISSQTIHYTPNSPPLPIPSSQHSIQYTLPLTEAQVRMELRKIKARKAAGPDGISSRLLKTCADQLCSILLYMFDLSLKLGKVPQIWKTSCAVPVPKTPRPKDFGDYRPVSLTSHLMKTLERLVLTHLRPLVSPSMDPLQFAYQPGIGVEDAVMFLLNRAIAHLEKAGSTVRVMFFDFSSAFNIIQPALLRDKMVYMPGYWTTSQTDHTPQGTVLAPFLFTIYTADFMFSSATCQLQKFSDDSAIVGLITNDDDRDYRGLIKNFVDWCQRSCLQINAGKTKELVVDFRRNKQILSPVNNHQCQGRDIVRVDSYKYLGVHLNNKLDWTNNTEAIYKKGQSRLFLLRRLRSFGVQGELLKTLFDSVVASAIFYGVVCWGSSISTADRKRLDKRD
ncbi:hypothetical protein C0J45_9938 [Silurus meridionalis]|nr:hypothetical protein C0J45_9938 [Silurus meridionalis]